MSSTKTLVRRSSMSPAKTSGTATGMISQRCLGIVLVRISAENGLSTDRRQASTDGVDASSSSTVAANDSEDWMYESGYLVFQDFQEQNRQCFWNRTLMDGVDGIDYLGYVAPGTMLVGGNEYFLEAIRSAWARRVLKPPISFAIARLGDVTGLEMQVIAQTQFTPLPEALCLVISQLNSDHETASLEIIFDRLRGRFADMIVPNQDIVYASLGKLIKDRKVYHTSEGYFIVTPETYHVTTTVPTMPERPLLLTNEEAIERLHGGQLLSPSWRPSSSTEMRSRSVQTDTDEMATTTTTTTPWICRENGSPSSVERHLNFLGRLERSGSLRLSRKEKHKSKENGCDQAVVRSESMRLSPDKSKSLIKDINLKSSAAHRDIEKGEKVSVFLKLFRRGSSKRRKDSRSPSKRATFSAQFPPLEWSDPNIVHYHSRSTQTLDGGSGRRQRSSSSSSSYCRLRTMGSDSRLVTRLAATTVTATSAAVACESDVHRNGIQRPLSSVAIANMTTAASNGDATTPIHKSNGLNNGHHLDSATVSQPSATSSKCKGDGVTRLRGPDEFHLRVRSATLDAVGLQQPPPPKPEETCGPVGVQTPASRVTSTTSSSGLPVRKLHSHSCIVLQESPSAKRRTSSKVRDGSPATTTATATAAQFSPPPSRTSSKTLSTSSAKIMNTDRTSSYISGKSHRRPSTDEVKVKNTESQAVRDSKRPQNRWSIHGEAGTRSAVGGTTTTTTTTTNDTESPSKKNPCNSNSSRKYPVSTKYVNKLQNSSCVVGSPSSPSSIKQHGSNVTVAVRPTQAIRPLPTQTQMQKNGTEDAPKSAEEVSQSGTTLTPSLSFNKSFDIESSAFKSITAQKVLKGASSIDSIDTLVEVNMAAENTESESATATATADVAVAVANGHHTQTKVNMNNRCTSASMMQGRIVGQAHKVLPKAQQELCDGRAAESYGDLKKRNDDTSAGQIIDRHH